MEILVYSNIFVFVYLFASTPLNLLIHFSISVLPPLRAHINLFCNFIPGDHSSEEDDHCTISITGFQYRISFEGTYKLMSLTCWNRPMYQNVGSYGYLYFMDSLGGWVVSNNRCSRKVNEIKDIFLSS